MLASSKARRDSNGSPPREEIEGDASGGVMAAAVEAAQQRVEVGAIARRTTISPSTTHISGSEAWAASTTSGKPGPQRLGVPARDEHVASRAEEDGAEALLLGS
jgi:hypothetical protein